MKMENNLLAEKDGTIKVVKVNLGDNVLQGDLLIEME
jgi:biotin carboxyl carrier protein